MRFPIGNALPDGTDISICGRPLSRDERRVIVRETAAALGIAAGLAQKLAVDLQGLLA
jgi:hypothetical protein